MHIEDQVVLAHNPLPPDICPDQRGRPTDRAAIRAVDIMLPEPEQVWERVAIGLRFQIAYTASKGLLLPSIEDALSAARRSVSGESQSALAREYDVKPHVIRKLPFLVHTIMSWVLTEEERESVGVFPVTLGRDEQHAADTYKRYQLLIPLLQQDSKVWQLAQANPHFLDVISLLSQGYNTLQIANMYSARKFIDKRQLYNASTVYRQAFMAGTTMVPDPRKDGEEISGYTGHGYVQRLIFSRYLTHRLNAPLLSSTDPDSRIIDLMQRVVSSPVTRTDGIDRFSNLRQFMRQFPLLEASLVRKYRSVLRIDTILEGMSVDKYLALYEEAGIIPLPLEWVCRHAANGTRYKQMWLELRDLGVYYALDTATGWFNAGKRFMENALLSNRWERSNGKSFAAHAVRSRSIEIALLMKYLAEQCRELNQTA